MDSPEVILWLGLPRTGRRELLRDVTHSLSSSEEKTLFLFGAAEPSLPMDDWFSEAEPFLLNRFQWNGKSFELPELPEVSPDRIVWMIDGLGNPLDQLEAIKEWLKERQWTVSRAVSIVSGQILNQHPKLSAYYEACIHFSDMVLLNQRENLSPDWGQKFMQKYEKECYPCHFEQVKHHRVRNPALVLDSLPRRLSQYFDSLENLESSPFEGLPDHDFEFEDDFDNEEKSGDDDIPDDPMMARNLGGDRKFKVPDLHFLRTEDPA